jgi:hypothetical protein
MRHKINIQRDTRATDLMTVVGQQCRFGDVRIRSAKPPITTKSRTSWDFSFGPLSDMPRRARQASEGRDGRRPFSPFVVSLQKSSVGRRAPIADKFAKS